MPLAWLKPSKPARFVEDFMLVFAGLRMQEALGLTRGDFDFENNLIRLRWQLSRAAKNTPGERVPLKAKGSARDIRLIPELRKILLVHKAKAFECGLAGSNDFVFVTETGRPMYHRNVAVRGLDKAADRAGLNPEGKTRLQPHDLRRTFGSHLALSAREFEQAGHADAVAEKMEEALGGIIDTGIGGS